jgi:aminopeptidase N
MLEMVVIHEIGHQWWQSMVAFNEAEEPWLDEGFTEYSAARAMDVTYGEETSFIDTRRLRLSALDLRRAEYLSNPQVPMYGRAWDFQGGDYSVGAYAKPALSLRTLERTLGEEVMLDLMRTFFQRYQFGHPTTEDFRVVAEEVSGQDLGWFFDGLVYDDGVLNYAATGVGEHSVTVTRQGELRVPTEILVTFADGSQVLEPWEGQEQETTFTYQERPPVRSVQIDPENKIIVDLQWGDNGLSRRLEVRPWLAVVSRLLVNLQNALLTLGGL